MQQNNNQYHHTRFKPLDEDDLKLMHRWFKEPGVNQFYARGIHWPLDAIRKKYLPRISGTERIPSFIIYNNNYPLGFIQYYVLTESFPEGIRSFKNSLFKKYPADQLVGIDLFIANSDNRGKGLGQQIIDDFICQFLLDFGVVVVDPEAGNYQAIRCYEKAGFEHQPYSDDPHYLIMMKAINKS